MVQEIGETRNAIIEDDEKRIQQILDANKERTSLYWIVIFSKPSRNSVNGKFTLVKHIKPYGTKPKSMVGMIIGEVDNSKGTLTWEVNMPQAPINYNKLHIFGVEQSDEIITETTTIPNAYITQ